MGQGAQGPAVGSDRKISRSSMEGRSRSDRVQLPGWRRVPARAAGWVNNRPSRWVPIPNSARGGDEVVNKGSVVWRA